MAIDLTGKTEIKYDIYASRTGSNIKIGIYEGANLRSEHTANISTANTWETQTWDISAVADADKDAIDKIIVTVVNADAANVFYIDNMFGTGALATLAYDTINDSENVTAFRKTLGITLYDTIAVGLMRPGDAYTKLLLHCDGENGSTIFIDDEITPKAVTAGEDACIDTSNSKFNGASAYFDGANGYLSLLDSDDWNLGTGDFTIDLRWFADSGLNSMDLFASQNDGTNYWQFARRTWLIDKIPYTGLIIFYNESTTTKFAISAVWAAPLDTWHHIAVVRKDITSWYILVNGTALTLQTPFVPEYSLPNLAAPFRIISTAEWESWIDEYRFSKGIARWTSNFTPPTAPYGIYVQGTINVTADLADSIAVSESLTKTLDLSCNLADTITDTDYQGIGIAQSLFDDIDILEDITPLITVLQSLYDLVRDSENLDVLTTGDIDATESIYSRDVVLTELSVGIEVFDDVRFEPSPPDDIVITDLSIAQNVNDTDTISEEVIPLLTELVQNITDQVEVSEDVAIAIGIGQSVSDDIEVSEDIFVLIPEESLVEETIYVRDTASQDLSIGNDIADSVTDSEEVTGSIAISVSIDDQISVSEDLTDNVTPVIVLSDINTVNDFTLLDIPIEGSYLDVNYVKEDVIPLIPVLVQEITDEIKVSEEVAGNIAIAISVDDQIEVSDDLSVYLETGEVTQETIYVRDTADTYIELNASIGDDITDEDTAEGLETQLLSIDDQINVSEDFSVYLETGEVAQETIYVRENIAAAIDLAIEVSDTITDNDIAGVLLFTGRSVADQINVLENIAQNVTPVEVAQETIYVREDVSVDLETEKVIFDVNRVREDVTPLITVLVQNIFDTISDSEGIGKDNSMGKNVADTDFIREQVDGVVHHSKVVFDIVYIRDRVFPFIPLLLERNISDRIEVDEDITPYFIDVLARTIAETIWVRENITKELNLNANLFDTYLISDWCKPPFAARPADGIVVSDVTNQNIPISISISDDISVFENTNAYISINLTLIDRVNVRESIIKYVSVGINTRDRISVSDWTKIDLLAANLIDDILVREYTETSERTGVLVIDTIYDSENVLRRIRGWGKQAHGTATWVRDKTEMSPL